MKCAIVEYSWAHGEVLPTFVHIMNRLGIQPHVYMSSRIMKNDPFVYTPGLELKAGNSHGVRFKSRVENSGFRDYNFVVLNSLEPKRVLAKAAAINVPVLAVMHNGELIQSDPDYKNFFNVPHREPVLLAECVSTFLSDGRSPAAPWIAPIVVANIPVRPPVLNQQVRFCVQGNMAFDRRNYGALLDAVEFMVKQGRTGFVVSLVGRRRPDGRRFHSEAVRRCLGGFFEYAETGIERLLEFAGRGIPYRKYYQFLAQSHFILPLVDRSPEYEDYYKGKITSSLSVSLGMGLVPLIDAGLALRYGVTDGALTYGPGGLAQAMLTALDLDDATYRKKQHCLRELREKFLIDSVENIRGAVSRITRS